jgi:hypothetical protein
VLRFCISNNRKRDDKNSARTHHLAYQCVSPPFPPMTSSGVAELWRGYHLVGKEKHSNLGGKSLWILRSIRLRI